jgi:hypothetical protein
MATWRQSLATLGLAHVAIFRGIRLKTQLLVCHEVAHVVILLGQRSDLGPMTGKALTPAQAQLFISPGLG